MYFPNLIPLSLLALIVPFIKALPTGSDDTSASSSEESLIGHPPQQYVKLRIEGDTNTIYEFPIVSGPRNITTASGGNHRCDGTNNGWNLTPGNTPTAALDAASKLSGFTYDGIYYDGYDDFFITRISTSAETSTRFWSLLVNYKFAPIGGCMFKTQPHDNVLWAYDAFYKSYFLKVTPAEAVVPLDGSLTVTVTDGATGVAISGALIGGVLTDASGKATLSFPHLGIKTFKATRNDSVRSNALIVAVL